MKRTIAKRTAAAAFLLAVSAMLLGGCAQNQPAPIPAGMKVGTPLTDAQRQAIVQKRMAGWKNTNP